MSNHVDESQNPTLNQSPRAEKTVCMNQCEVQMVSIYICLFVYLDSAFFVGHVFKLLIKLNFRYLDLTDFFSFFQDRSLYSLAG